ncbi:MAG: exodeoxyribonuclease III [Alphaproteobacteria bacterium CG_4_9_14_3_um_filter_47_13]|nr:MAG: exodeoxyribonuclease III [Alphaproteobacteria bacterium CG_4_9_14_3_um_filter_47_13]
MRIASWNINSIKMRLEHVRNWLRQHQPDVLLLQELKGLEFPAAEFRALGYQSAVLPQKAYNGVATLARHDIKIEYERLPGDPLDEQARYLETTINGLRVIGIYAPNGNPVESDKFSYKLSWLDRLQERLKLLREDEIPVVIGGDFNIIPESVDCYDPVVWKEDALFRLETRKKWRSILNLGYTDAFRIYNKQAQQYSFWDYQAGAWPQNRGIRIDHFLLSPDVTDRMVSCTIDTIPRGLEKASDHTPVIVEIK